jgi:hypothetical protein
MLGDAGLQGEQVYDSSVAWSVTITGTWNAASTSNNITVIIR